MMEHNHEEMLSDVFHALADSTRREMIHMMADKERTVSELAAPFEMSLAAVSKHVKVLERANLIHREINGRTHICRLNADMLAKATDWLRVYEGYWTRRFDLLESELLKAETGAADAERRNK